MDRLDRRGFLSCMAWTGSALVWTSTAGVLSSRTIRAAEAADPAPGGFSFVQISDTHIGFKGQANSDAAATLQQLIDRVNALKPAPAFVLHTGDQTHGQKPGAFDTLAEMLKSVKTERMFYVPGEHDVFLDGGKEYLSRYGKGTVGERGWQSFDYKGTHFVGLVNVLKYKGEGMGALGEDQIEWLAKDVAPLASSTPVVVFSHVPLWAVYPQWGWGTDDSARALSYLKRFGSVSVLNGHIHQVMQKVEGNVTFHTAMSTAFPQPEPGTAPSPGPMKVPDDRLRKLLGLSSIAFHDVNHPIAITDVPLERDASSAASLEIAVDNFSFTPATIAVPAGSTLTWTNRDDVPHNIVSTERKFKSPILDTEEHFSHRFDAPGSYPYFCSLHPRMTGTVVVG